MLLDHPGTSILPDLRARTTPSRLFAEANVNLEALDGFAFASRKLPEYMHWRLMSLRPMRPALRQPAPAPEDLADPLPRRRFRQPRGGPARQPDLRPVPPRDRPPGSPTRTGPRTSARATAPSSSELLAAGFPDVSGIEPSTGPDRAADQSVRPLIRHDSSGPTHSQPGR